MSFFGKSNSITGTLTGGLVDPKAPNYAGVAATNEKNRQRAINLGMQNINSVFGGGTVPQYSLATGTFNPATQYYKYNNAGGYTPWKTPSFLDPTGTNAAHLAKQYPKFLGKNQLYSRGPDQQFAGFDDNFFNKAGQDYTDYALPQLGQQYNQAQRDITYSLANKGLIGGSANNRAMSDLNIQTGQTEQGIADTARQTSQSLRTQIEDARQNAINNLYTSVDPAQALQQSTFSAAQFRVPQSFTPLANAFSNITNQYANQQFYNNIIPSLYGTGGVTGLDYTSPSLGALGKVTY